MSPGVHGFKRLKAAIDPPTPTVPIAPALLLSLGLAAGAVLFFWAEQRPDAFWYWGAWTTMLCGIVALRLLPRFRKVALIVTGVALGLLVSDVRLASIERALPDSELVGRVEVTGWLERVERSGSGRTRLVVRIGEGNSWYRVRVIGRPAEARPGDRLSIPAMLAPPRGAVVPGGYDGRYYAWFQRIRATGFALSQPEVLTDNGRRGPLRSLARWRNNVALAIRSRLEGPAAGIAAALLVGDRSGIDPETAESLRIAGLGHILAISGLHMALMAGGTFFAVRLGLSSINSLARRHDVARLAAVLALAVSSAYLIISGAGIPTQRAFVVTFVALGAVIAGRRPFSLHSFALALGAVVVIQPESVVSPGFQMSFSAVGALIAVHEWRRARMQFSERRLPGFLRPFWELALTSFIAGTATAVIGAFHFHRLASYGLLGNLLAMPVFSFLVMPAGVLGLLLMPVGLDGPAFALMEAGLNVILNISRWIEALPTAARGVPAVPGWWLALYVVLAAVLVLGRGLTARLLTGGLAAALIGIWAVWPQPDVYISADGVVVARNGESWTANTLRRGRFGRQVFLERLAMRGADGERAACDELGCLLDTGGMRIAVPTQIEALQEDCERSDLVVLSADTPDWIARRCERPVIALSELARRGNALVWLGADGISRIRYVDTAETSWPWQG